MTARARARAALRRGLRSIRLSGPLGRVALAAREAANAGVGRAEMMQTLRACENADTSGPSSRRSSPAGARRAGARS